MCLVGVVMPAEGSVLFSLCRDEQSWDGHRHLLIPPWKWTPPWRIILQVSPPSSYNPPYRAGVSSAPWDQHWPAKPGGGSLIQSLPHWLLHEMKSAECSVIGWKEVSKVIHCIHSCSWNVIRGYNVTISLDLGVMRDFCYWGHTIFLLSYWALCSSLLLLLLLFFTSDF